MDSKIDMDRVKELCRKYRVSELDLVKVGRVMEEATKAVANKQQEPTRILLLTDDGDIIELHGLTEMVLREATKEELLNFIKEIKNVPKIEA